MKAMIYAMAVLALSTNLLAENRKLDKLGLLRVAKKQIPTFGMPLEYHKAYYKVVVRASYYETYIREMKSFGERSTST